jgi:hypothetical protein
MVGYKVLYMDTACIGTHTEQDQEVTYKSTSLLCYYLYTLCELLQKSCWVPYFKYFFIFIILKGVCPVWYIGSTLNSVCFISEITRT